MSPNIFTLQKLVLATFNQFSFFKSNTKLRMSGGKLQRHKSKSLETNFQEKRRTMKLALDTKCQKLILFLADILVALALKK